LGWLKPDGSSSPFFGNPLIICIKVEIWPKM
jgi:hypothetical protein